MIKNAEVKLEKAERKNKADSDVQKLKDTLKIRLAEKKIDLRSSGMVLIFSVTLLHT